MLFTDGSHPKCCQNGVVVGCLLLDLLPAASDRSSKLSLFPFQIYIFIFIFLFLFCCRFWFFQFLPNFLPFSLSFFFLALFTNLWRQGNPSVVISAERSCALRTAYSSSQYCTGIFTQSRSCRAIHYLDIYLFFITCVCACGVCGPGRMNVSAQHSLTLATEVLLLHGGWIYIFYDDLTTPSWSATRSRRLNK